MAPILSPVYKTADESERATPSMQERGRVCEDIDPMLVSGLPDTASDRSLVVSDSRVPKKGQ
jgi:hypothetical protein